MNPKTQTVQLPESTGTQKIVLTGSSAAGSTDHLRGTVTGLTESKVIAHMRKSSSLQFSALPQQISTKHQTQKLFRTDARNYRTTNQIVLLDLLIFLRRQLVLICLLTHNTEQFFLSGHVFHPQMRGRQRPVSPFLDQYQIPV